MSAVFKRLAPYTKHAVRWYCPTKKTYECKLLVVGGGAGGCSVAWRFARKLKNCLIVLEPCRVHYYQPGFTLVGAGIKNLQATYKPLPSILPHNITWIHDRAEGFCPSENLVVTWNGDKIYYEYMVIAVGIRNDYDKVIGLVQALDNPRCPVSTIYSPMYCSKTWMNIKEFNGGHALFTFPVVGGKCSGAAMKIMFLAQDYWRKQKIIGKTNITYNTGAEDIFGVPKYADAIRALAVSRGIVPNYGADLVEVSPKGAVFMGPCGETICFPYNMLHVTPPMAPQYCLQQCGELSTAAGYLDVNTDTLQHTRYPNVFGLGDCTCTPNSKTAAAVAPQSYVVERNLRNVMSGKAPSAKYNGYGACPLITSYRKGMLAEFVYNKKIWETFPFDQAKERRIIYQINKYVLPYIYWNSLVKGKWNGPGTIRNIINPLRR
uniref:SFRICE_006337 n=1 Tax=Spodoptera frugiperda TaxID=7108 RepID=A0A2H1VXM1_SPOFR